MSEQWIRLSDAEAAMQKAEAALHTEIERLEREMAEAGKVAEQWWHAAGWASGHGDTLADILCEMRSQHCDERSYADLAASGGLPETQELHPEIARLRSELEHIRSLTGTLNIPRHIWDETPKGRPKGFDAGRRVAALLTMLAEARADSERLDWLESGARHIPKATMRWASGWDNDGVTLRSAIDAARAEVQGGG